MNFIKSLGQKIAFILVIILGAALYVMLSISYVLQQRTIQHDVEQQLFDKGKGLAIS
jgi:hypothetical protein